MFKCILVILDSAEIEQDLCQVAFESSKTLDFGSKPSQFPHD
jgi:hypothetical protein